MQVSRARVFLCRLCVHRPRLVVALAFWTRLFKWLKGGMGAVGVLLFMLRKGL